MYSSQLVASAGQIASSLRDSGFLLGVVLKVTPSDIDPIRLQVSNLETRLYERRDGPKIDHWVVSVSDHGRHLLVSGSCSPPICRTNQTDSE